LPAHVEVEEDEASSMTDGSSAVASASERWAWIVTAVAVVVAFPVIMYYGRDQWFFLDEWAFLAGREGFSADGLLRPHNEHWVTLPVIVYRTLHRIFGLNAYWPYQAVAVATHLTVAVLLRAVMRQAAVDPWVATAATILFLFLGAGRTNISYAFQMQFTGALAFGLIQLLLISRPPREGQGLDLDWRDALGLAAGVGALMCSSVGVAMAVAAGVAALLARGWRVALVHTVPLAVTYLAWYVAYGSEGVREDATAGVGDTVRFAVEVVGNGFDAMGQITGVGILLGGLAVLGIVLAVRETVAGDARVAGPVGLAVAGAVLTLIVGYGRAALPEPFSNPHEPRYLYLVVALALPIVTVGASWIAERAWWALALVIVVLLAGLPANIDKLEPTGLERVTLGDPGFMAALADEAVARQPPRDLHPLPDTAPEVTVGWLIRERDAGRIDRPGRVSPQTRASAVLALSLRQVTGPRPDDCRPAAALSPTKLRGGQVLSAPTGSGLAVVDPATNGRVSYTPDAGPDTVLVRVEAEELAALVGSSEPGELAQVCG
jgi:hypothetical protein